MILPVQTTFRNVDVSPAVAARVQKEAEKLRKYFEDMTSCHVIVEAPHRHHLHGKSFPPWGSTGRKAFLPDLD
jgi:ribosome-associated translation inhibitor RaiA